MPANKNALTRIVYLDEYLSDRLHHYTTRDIKNKCNERLYDAGLPEVSLRCIEKDINYLEYAPFYAEIERFVSNGDKCVRYKDPSYSIFKKELSEEERNLIHEVLKTIGQFEGLANFEWLENLRIGLGFKKRRKLISFSNNPYLENSNLLGVLFDYISNRVAVKLEYHTFKDGVVKDIVFHPYLLKQYNNRWFLLGAADEDNKILNFALDRINDVTPLPGLKYRKCKVNLADRFENIIGVTLYEDKKVENIVFWVSDYSKEYVRTKPLHGSQKHFKGDKELAFRTQYPNLEGGYFFSIKCIPNYEFVRELSSFGRDLLVLSPNSIKDEIIERIRNFFDAYTLI